MASTVHDQPKITGVRTSWAQPSLSRDFALLATAIIFIMLLMSAWVAWVTYLKHSERLISELELETERIERILDGQIVSADYLLSAIGRQLSTSNTTDLPAVARLLQNYAAGNPKYALWSWADTTQHIVASSNKGVLEQPVDVQDRDFIRTAHEEPWIPHIGMPIEGRVSGRWVIPVGMGIADPTGKYLGALSVSLDIGAITDQIRQFVKRDGISFAVFSKTLSPLTSTGETAHLPAQSLPVQNLADVDLVHAPRGVLSHARLLTSSGIYSYYLASEHYPYLIIVGYDPEVSNSAMRSLLWPRLAQIAVLAGFLLASLWVIRARVITPAMQLGTIAGHMASGQPFKPLPKAGPFELEYLAAHIRRVGEYIAERRRVEQELHAKLAGMQQRWSELQTETRQRAVLLAGMLQEYKQPLRVINTSAQTLREQASDIYQAGMALELMVRKLIALSRADSVAVLMRDEPVIIAKVAEKAHRFAAEDLAQFPAIHTDLGQAPALLADAACLSQAIAYSLLYFATLDAQEPISLQWRSFTAHGDDIQLLLIGYGTPPLESALLALETESMPLPDSDTPETLHLSLAHALFRLQKMKLGLLPGEKSGKWIAVYIPKYRLNPVETHTPNPHPEEDS